MNEQTNEKNGTQKTFDYYGILRSFTCGAVVGCGVAVVTFPFEQLKKRFQEGKKLNLQGEGIIQKYKDLGKKMVVTKEIPIWGPGYGVFMAHVGPATAIQFTAKNLLKDHIQPNAPIVNSVIASFSCGFTGGIVSTLVESTVVRAQIWSKEYNRNFGLSETLSKVIREHGLRAPWHSFFAVATRDGIFTTSMFLSVTRGEYIEKKLRENYGTSISVNFINIIINLSLATASAAVSHPFDCIGTRMQIDFAKHSYIKTINMMWTEAKYKAFYAGFPFRLILFLVYSKAFPFFMDKTEPLFDLITRASSVPKTPDIQKGERFIFFSHLEKKPVKETDKETDKEETDKETVKEGESPTNSP